jgi:hypothetical protein
MGWEGSFPLYFFIAYIFEVLRFSPGTHHGRSADGFEKFEKTVGLVATLRSFDHSEVS